MESLNFFPPRSYQGSRDLAAMEQVQQAGALAHTNTHYIHTGDLRWWLFYGPPDFNVQHNTALWDDPTHPGRCLGWAMIDDGWPSFDVFVQPELLGTPLWSEMLTWAENEAVTAYHRLGPESQAGTLNKMWVSREDTAQIAHFESHGFHPTQWDCSFRRTLTGAIPAPILPAGYHLRLCRGLDELADRAPAQYGAFNNKMPWEKYLRRFDYFMRSEAYAGALDVVAVAPDGRIAAFCIAWPDPVTHEGHFEPVGTAPEFQGLGLGKAVLYETMARLQAAGMTQVSVVTPEENLPAVALYRSVGFETIGWLGRFVREIE